MLANPAARLSPGTVLTEGEPLAGKTTFGIGGTAQWYAEPATVADLRLLLRAAQRLSLPVFMLGRGSNILALEHEIKALVIRLRHPWWRKTRILPNGHLQVGAGVRLRDLCGHAWRGGLSGFEFLEGIPGTLGGALRMNAGAMGGWIYELVESIRLIDGEGNEKRLTRGQLHFGYRHCRELEGACAVEAELKPKGKASVEAIGQTLARFREHRQITQPKEPSAGCMFKNPPDDSAGRIIEQLGMKGARVGDAEVSPVHANFIINRGRATTEDVIDLVRQVREEVWRGKRIMLEPEVLLLGAEWREKLA